MTDAAGRPNIVVIMTDQQTAAAMSCAGNADLAPHLIFIDIRQAIMRKITFQSRNSVPHR